MEYASIISMDTLAYAAVVAWSFQMNCCLTAPISASYKKFVYIDSSQPHLTQNVNDMVGEQIHWDAFDIQIPANCVV